MITANLKLNRITSVSSIRAKREVKILVQTCSLKCFNACLALSSRALNVIKALLIETHSCPVVLAVYGSSLFVNLLHFVTNLFEKDCEDNTHHFLTLRSERQRKLHFHFQDEIRGED